jgi:protein O-mannosyl-transferase
MGALLFAAVAGVFSPALTHGFITYDDPVYVTENPHVTGGLTWENLQWAFRSTEASNWHPLTWVSHMADCQLYGLQPWGHHLTNVLLHAVNAVLLFVVLRRMTGAPWRSWFVAALFGLHPLHVESVAWISERKDLLSTTFWMLVLWAYARRAECLRARAPDARAYYGLALLLFALGLMCKPMLVTLPCVLLLLDFWPLDRWGGDTAPARGSLLAEKIPFLALSAAACAVTLFAQGHGGTMGSAEDFPLPVRAANALLSYCRYLGKCFDPQGLAVFYPFFAEQAPLRDTLEACALLVAVTAAAAALHRRQPYLLVGWLWYAGTLVPVIGFVQIGGQSMADRYTYVPMIGIFIMAVWGTTALAARWARGPRLAAAAGAAVIAALAFLASRQLALWSDGATLFRHAAAVTENNWVAHANLFATLSKRPGADAGAEMRETVRILANFAETHERKGLDLERIPGRLPDAIKEFRTTIRIMPTLPGPHNNLGTALAATPGRLKEAADEFREAVSLKPDFADAHFNLGLALAKTPGHAADAIQEFRTAARLVPDFADAHYSLALLLSQDPGGQPEAIDELRTVIALEPGNYQAHFELGLLLSRLPGQAGDAIQEFETVLRMRPDMAQARTLIDRLRAPPER